MTNPTPAPEPGQLGRRFRILGTIGSGGFGTVYKAELLGEGGFRKVFALKVLNPDVEVVTEVAQRLRDEARILGLVHHRAIVQADSLIQLGGRWAVVMEYVQGVDLREVVAHGPIPLGPALEILEEVAEALNQAHAQPGPDGSPLCLLHRDIKPPNVQITSAGEVKVLDFGTARANFAKREAKTQDLAFGTIDYMSPERMEFEDTAAGDVYALGAVLFELLTASPLGRTSPILRRHEAVLARATEALAGQPAEVRDLILQCLAFEGAARPTAEALAKASRRLRRQVQTEEWLVEWAGAHVPAWVAARGELKTDDLTGKVLSEYGPMPLPPKPPPKTATPPPAPTTGASTRVLVHPEPAEGVSTATPAPAPTHPPETPVTAWLGGAAVFLVVVTALSLGAVAAVLAVVLGLRTAGLLGG